MYPNTVRNFRLVVPLTLFDSVSLLVTLPIADWTIRIRIKLMAHENHSELDLPRSPESPDEPCAELAGECPLRRVMAVNERGMVVESRRDFEVGAAMIVGCHVEVKAGACGTASAFVSAEVIVVESRPLAVGTGSRSTNEGRFQVTLLFSEISREDRELLVNLSDIKGIRLASGRAACRSGLAIPPPQVFPAVAKRLRTSHLRGDGGDPAAGSDGSLN